MLWKVIYFSMRLVLEYNFPPEMCEYSGFIVPYHLNQEIVYGPPVVYSCPFIVREGDNTKVENRYCTGSCSPVDSACLKGDADVKGADRNTCSTKNACESENCGKLPGRWSTGPDACLDKDSNNIIAETGCGNREDCIDIDHNCGKGTAGAGKWQPGYNCGIGAPSGHSKIQEVCGKYDKSGQDLGNCCLGTYVVRKGSNELASESGKWGDDLKQCIGGPGRFAWDSYSDKGVPLREVTNTGKDGLRDEYELDAIINVHNGHKVGVSKVPSFITANFWEDVEDKDFISSESKVKIYFPPKPERPFIEAENIRGEPYFVWTCMDSAREVRHRIILLIREWNTQTEYNKFKESLGSGGDPDVEGEEGSLCDYYTSEEAGTSDDPGVFRRDSYCNDLFDLDDWEQRPPYPRSSDPYPEVIYKGEGE